MLKIRLCLSALLSISFSALLCSGADAFAQTASADKVTEVETIKASSEPAFFGFDQDSDLEERNEIYEELISERASSSNAPGISIYMTPEDLSQISDQLGRTGSSDSNTRLHRVGLVKSVDLPVDFSQLRIAHKPKWEGTFARGSFKQLEDGLIWTLNIKSKGAAGLRMRLSDVVIPDYAELFIYNRSGEAYGPFSDFDDYEGEEIWLNTLTGPNFHIQLRIYGALTTERLSLIRFTIKEIAHLGPRFKVSAYRKRPTAETQSLCTFNASCIEDGSCFGRRDWRAIRGARNAVAHILFKSGGSFFICSGGLLSDTDASTQVPLFLTANHCIDESAEASSMEAFWAYRTAYCGAPCFRPDGAVPSTVGASILSTGTRGDYTLLQLNRNPPSGSVFLAWNNQPVAFADGNRLFRISHPRGAPQAFSSHTVDTAADSCSDRPLGPWIYSRDIIGGIEKGSSGAPILNAAGEVVGQLTGSCGQRPGEACLAAENATIDGALATYFPDVAPWLNPQRSVGTLSVSRIIPRIGRRLATATIIIVDNNGNPVRGAQVTGSFSGDVGGTRTAVTNRSGRAKLRSKRNRNITSVEFCVDNVTHGSLSYNAGGNRETCDSL